MWATYNAMAVTHGPMSKTTLRNRFEFRVYKGYFGGAAGAAKILGPLSTRYFGIFWGFCPP